MYRVSPVLVHQLSRQPFQLPTITSPIRPFQLAQQAQSSIRLGNVNQRRVASETSARDNIAAATRHGEARHSSIRSRIRGYPALTNHVTQTTNAFVRDSGLNDPITFKVAILPRDVSLFDLSKMKMILTLVISDTPVVVQDLGLILLQACLNSRWMICPS